MSVYRDHIAPQESIEEYLVRIEREKLEDAARGRPKAPPQPLPATQIRGLSMAPMGVVFA